MAVGLLTRVPVASAGWDRQQMTESVAWMPIVGGMIGAVLALAYSGLLSLMPGTLAAVVTVAAGTLLTGALHEDGLADTADAFGGATEPGEVMRILKDPRHGTYGVVAVALSVLLRVAAIAGLDTAAAFAVLPAAHALGRGGSVALITLMRPASEEGLGAAHFGSDLSKWGAIGLISALGVGVATMGWSVWMAILAAVLGAAAVGGLAARRIGGFTGDVLGAAEQGIEIGVLAVGAALVFNGAQLSVWWL